MATDVLNSLARESSTDDDSVEGCLCECEEDDMKDVSDWVRSSVLFWNQSDQQLDAVSIDEGSEDGPEQAGNRADCRSDVSVQEQENGVVLNSYEKEEALPNNFAFEELRDSPTEPTRILNSDVHASTSDMIVDVEKLQRIVIQPFLMDNTEDKENYCERLDNESPCYTLNFPKYTEHVYSPLYEERVGLRREQHDPELTKESDWNIAERLNRLSQTRCHLISVGSTGGVSQREETGQSKEEYGNAMEGKSVDSDVFKAIRKVQDTLGEIADELETTRTRKSSKDKDPNLILINLLSSIQPPVNRDSYAYSPTEDASQTCQEHTDLLESVNTQGGKMPRSTHEGDGIDNHRKCQGSNEDFDVFKELSDPQKSTEDVLQEFMQKLSTASKPSSAIRGLLKRISEEITSDNCVEQSVYQNGCSDISQFGVVDGRSNDVSELKASREVNVERESCTECETVHEQIGKHESEQLRDKIMDSQGKRRISSVSGNSSLPTSPGATNYDSGFSELTKSLNYTRKESLTSFLPDESTKMSMERRLKEAFEKTKSGFDSETSTDWSPCSTLSNADFALKRTTGLKHSPFQRVTPRRRSTGMTNSKPSFKLQPGNTNSCPNFDRTNPNFFQDPVKRYTKTELEAIRKFLSLTSLYFGCRGTMPSEIQTDTYDELMQRGDIELIHEILKQQKCDLEKQRKTQDELYNRIGEMLLQLVTLKEEHMISTQKQTKALTLLKRQLDMQKKDQQRAQEVIKDQVNSLREEFSSVETIDRGTTPPVGMPASVNEKHMGQIIWKITGITRKVTRIHAGSSDNVSISDPFYSGPYGYKMAAWVYLNGRADFRGKGISVYVCPLCGEYDAILPWPIKPVYTFTLIDQNPDPRESRNHVKVRNLVEISKKGDTALSNKGGIPRPQPGSKSFIIGFDDFISQADLAKGKYIVDDTMFIKVKAEI